MKYPLFKVHVNVEEAMLNIKNVLQSGFINEGVQVTELTQKMSTILNAENLIMVNSCTSALTLAVRLSSQGKVFETVVSTPMTCVATNCPITNEHCLITWADIDPTTGCISPDSVDECLDDVKSCAVMAVAWAGNPPDLENLRKICDNHNVKLILDAAHAFGATYKGKPIHEWADYTCFPSTTSITTKDGLKKIKDVKIGDLVLTSSGEYKPVLNTLSKKYHGKWSSIKAGQAKISATSDHPIRVYRNNSEQWLPINQIKVGDQVFLETKTCTKCNNLVPYYIKTCKDCYRNSNRSLEKAKKLSKKSNKKSSRLYHHNTHVIPIMENYRKEDYKVIPLIHAIPDFLAIKDGKIIAVEVESGSNVRLSKATKYDKLGTDTYDDIQWHTLKPYLNTVRHNYEICGSFAKVLVWNIRIDYTPLRHRTVYNLTLSENDPTYVAGRILVHNCYSLQAIKHVTTGDGGILVCKSEDDFKLAKKLKWFGIDRDDAKTDKGEWKGQSWDIDIETAGYKFNMNNLSAAIGYSQVDHIENLVKHHRKNASTYDKIFKNSNIITPLKKYDGAISSHWVYTIITNLSIDEKLKVMQKLNDEGINVGLVHVPNHHYTCFKEFKKDLPGVEEFHARQLSLPCGWWLTTGNIQHIAKRVKALCKKD